MQDLLALNESIKIFFADFEFVVGFMPYRKRHSNRLHEVVVLIDILDNKDTILYSIFMALSHKSALNLTAILTENPQPEKDEINSTIMEMLNIFAGNALGDLPPFEDAESYYFLAPPILQTSYVVDPKDYVLELNRKVTLQSKDSENEDSLYFCLFRKLHEKK